MTEKHVRQKRDAVIKSVERLRKIGEDAEKDPLRRLDFQVRFEDLSVLKKEFDRFQAQTEFDATKKGTAEEVEELEVIREKFEDTVYAIKALFHKMFEPDRKPLTPVASVSTRNAKLPKLTVPTFAGDLVSWNHFADLFRSLVHNNESLSSVEKFHYLKLSLTDEPLNLVKNLLVTSNNYQIAWDMLEKRYANKRLIATLHVEKILSLPNSLTQSLTSLKTLVNTINENIAALKVLHLPVDSWSFLLLTIVLKKLDHETRLAWERTLDDHSAYPVFTDLLHYLEDQVSVLESLYASKTKFSTLSHMNTDKSRYSHVKSVSPSTLITSTNANSAYRCLICQSNHLVYHCHIYKKKTPKDRFNIVKQHNLCINCLSPSHALNSCPSVRSCATCGKRHHTTLHFNTQDSNLPAQCATTQVPTTAPVNMAVSGSEPSVSMLISSKSPRSTVLLATAVAEISDNAGTCHSVRVLLDCASQASYITESCVHRIGLQRRRAHIPIFALGEVPLDHARGIVSCNIHPRGQLTPSLSTAAIIVQRITGNMPSSMLSKEVSSHFQQLNLADPQFDTPSRVDLLLGADLFPQLLLGGRIAGPPGAPTALETVLGWVLMGETQLPAINAVNTFHLSSEELEDGTKSLNDIIKRFWEIEEVQPPSKAESPEDIQCEDIFKKTVQRDDCGRYSLALPFREYPPPLGDSYRGALQCFRSLQRRLVAKPKLQEDYLAFMKDYLDSGHMTLLENPDTSGNGYYIPHHCVLKPDSTSTKLRVVFNASKQTTSGLSLNDVLLTGPAMQQDLTSILLRFRFHTYVMTADIRQMYRQIVIQPEHRSFQRIVWTFDNSLNPQVYELNTVTYGMNCAPYLALRTLHQLATEERRNYPLAARALEHDTYVDDVITGCDTLSEAIKLQQELLESLKLGGFDLRKWSSNDLRVLSMVPESHKQVDSTQHLNLDRDTIIKVLGLRWNPTSDCFSYKIQSVNDGCTKRIIMSEVARIFDPLGWLSPLTMLAKRIIQILWSLSLDWDTVPPEEIILRWRTFQAQCPSLATLIIPRHIPTSTTMDLIGFCDASEAGYAAVIYSRSLDESDTPHIALLVARTRVAPLKRISLPRLELCAAVLLARLFKYVTNIIPNISYIYAWSDSTITLSWIRSSPHRWKTFVSNRVTEIQSSIPPERWHHIRSSDNPADCASRGMLPEDLLQHSLWWNGPPWLLSPPNSWPIEATKGKHSDTSQEMTSEARPFTLLTHSEHSFDLLNRYSSLTKLQRVTAYCIRFYNRCCKSQNSAPFLTSAELNHALLVLIKTEQASAFNTTLNALQNNKPCSRSLQQLSPFIDNAGILRVGGRIRHSHITYDQKHPILLPPRSRLTHLIIDQCHTQHMHPGPQTLHAILSQNYWIVSARKVIRSRLSRCLTCFRCDPKQVTPYMGDLPLRRVTRIKPFQVVGVDYGGPFTITFTRARGIKTQKAYLCLFVCFATKALHLELASSLSTEAFLAAFRRFIARRGRCTHIYSDCGTNFVGAKRYLSELFKLTHSQDYNHTMSSAFVEEGIEWHLNPPSAPHFGGIWEAGIKSVKKHLTRVIGEQILTYEELNTVFIEIEALLNSRPLCPLSSDPNDLLALTPGHFLIQEPLVRLPEPDVTSVNVNRLSRWQLLQQIQQHFWNRWHNEYLNTLQQRGKWNQITTPIEKGTLVLIKDDLLPPIRWRLGRVVAVSPGLDKITRVVSVRTSHGIITRPVAKLCVLPVESNSISP